MAETKDKVVTVESLATLHEHNKKSYMSMNNPVGTGTMTMDGDASFSGDVNIGSLTIGSSIDYLESLGNDESFFVNQNNSIKQINKSDIVFDIANGGTGATDAATALTNLGAVGYTAQTLAEDQQAQARANINAAPAYTYGTEDLIAGTSELASGTIYLVYEEEEP